MLDFPTEPVLPRVLHHTDDFVGVTVVSIRLRHMEADRITAGEEPLRERLVDHADRPAAGTILCRDLTAEQHGDAQRREVTGANGVVPGSVIAAAGRRVAF